ncbi:TNF receptor-associated factor 1-like [Lingula anatina]|uniref:TNF receptor-associated factor 1-like n=1 Tax=Lingula anatina TaxID=7574 RepID=A0A1S3HNU8_LINAN|nr:TNF receptor-associated factor 1-like [Lingula anatina]|eukprot:XP_013387710.1 TNF receptor-associated factor 1-like [Lingula anatina]
MYDRLILLQQATSIYSLVRRSQIQDEEILRRNRRLWDLELGSDKGTIVWKIEDFVRTSRKRVFMESPLLKTSPQGYAVRLNVHFEGDQGQRLSFSLRVQKGEHDGALEWPFRPVIRIGIITAFDQPLKFEKELDFKEADLSQIVGLQQPVSEENPKIDLVAIQTSDILERGCLVEGTLWIECTIQS